MGAGYGKQYTFYSSNYSTHVLRHRNGEIWLDKKDGTPLLAADSTFKLVPGLASHAAYSFESVNYPGQYLRHQNGLMFLGRSDGSDLFNKDATYYLRSDARGTQIESFNFPGYFVRHQNARVMVSRNDGTPLFRGDSTWSCWPGEYHPAPAPHHPPPHHHHPPPHHHHPPSPSGAAILGGLLGAGFSAAAAAMAAPPPLPTDGFLIQSMLDPSLFLTAPKAEARCGLEVRHRGPREGFQNFVFNPDYTISLVARPDLVLDAEGGEAGKRGCRIILFPNKNYPGPNNQKFVHDPSSGRLSMAQFAGLVFDIDGGKKKSGTKVIVWENKSGGDDSNQKWMIVKA
eukprot:TRINITY_DN333_c0_g1_i1.p1 TRINITY_DN333_c0_g1~~TRINITY_DN333_c0_g1_i1.p1  ORF type:complete len:342 (-),score=72.79 TRINITY_DN333_c0_g1_i1:103-1128(-)